jgi:hypothetical protein
MSFAQFDKLTIAPTADQIFASIAAFSFAICASSRL